MQINDQERRAYDALCAERLKQGERPPEPIEEVIKAWGRGGLGMAVGVDPDGRPLIDLTFRAVNREQAYRITLTQDRAEVLLSFLMTAIDRLDFQTQLSAIRFQESQPVCAREMSEAIETAITRDQITIARESVRVGLLPEVEPPYGTPVDHNLIHDRNEQAATGPKAAPRIVGRSWPVVGEWTHPLKK